jgi:probable F420-dependent oxidoreductase
VGMSAVPVVPEGRLVYGIQLPVQAQSSMFAFDWEAKAGPDEMARLARKADENGFFYVAVCDHVAIPRRAAPAMSTVWFDTVATLGFLAGVTTRTRLLSHVYVPAYRHPLVAAKAFATLDCLSGGRVIVGVGAGRVPEEFAALGVDFDRRGALLDEAIDALAAALGDEWPEVDGPTWSFRDVSVAPRPVQQPRPPIWVGGSSRPALRRAAERGDGWLPQGTPKRDLPAAVAYIRDRRRAVRGDDPIDVGTITEWLYVGEWTGEPRRGTLAGPPDRVAEGLREYGAIGVNHVQVHFLARSCEELEDQLDAFGRDVAPLLDE